MKNAIYLFFLKIGGEYKKIRSYFLCFFYSFNPGVKIGKNVFIGKHVKLDTAGGGAVVIGDNCEIHDFVQVISSGGEITIGKNCSFNPFCIVYGHGGVFVGDNTRIAAQTIIIPANHIFTNKDVSICLQGLTKKGIIIEDNVWVGAGCRILDGVIIKTGCVIGAGSVVNKNTVPFSVYAGVPANFIKKR